MDNPILLMDGSDIAIARQEAYLKHLDHQHLFPSLDLVIEIGWDDQPFTSDWFAAVIHH